MAAPIELAPDVDEAWRGDDEDLAAFRPIADTEVILALMPMSVLKALVGFLTFLFAFGLRREGAATWWFGLVLGGVDRRGADRRAAGVPDPPGALASSRC